MKWKPPSRIFPGLLLLATGIRLPAQQAPPSQPPQPTQKESGAAVPAPLSPKEMQVERARVQMAEKRYEAAIQTYLELLKDDPKNAVYLNMVGIAFLDLSNYEQSKRYFIRATKADKKYSSAVNNLGMVYYHQRNYKGAIREYQRAVAIDPDLAGTHSNLGFAYYNTNKFQEASVEFQKAIELDPHIFDRNDRVGTMVQDRSVSNHGLFFFTMAKVYAQKKDATHCAEYLRKSLDEGYKDIGKVRTDPAFKDVIDDPVMQAVMERITPAEQKGSGTQPGA